MLNNEYRLDSVKPMIIHPHFVKYGALFSLHTLTLRKKDSHIFGHLLACVAYGADINRMLK